MLKIYLQKISGIYWLVADDTFSSPEPFSLLAVTRGKIGSGIND